jgi:hypothetical protein
MRIFTCFLFLFGVMHLKGEMKHGRMSIIPEYDQNMVTILFSGHRPVDLPDTPFLFTVPLDVDTVSLIRTNPDGELDFIQVPTQEINEFKWVAIPLGLVEFAFMINSTKFIDPGDRHFEYDLSFSEKVGEFDLEIQEPLAAENFNYTGFQGQSAQDAHGQTTHAIQWTNIPANEIRSISMSYLNSRGLTTRSALAEIMALTQQQGQPDKPVKKIKRHRLYIWEPLIALGVVTVFTIIVMHYFHHGKTRNFNCSNCGHKLNPYDKFCPGCGKEI